MKRYLFLLILLIPFVCFGADMNSYPNETTMAVDDEFIFWDTSLGGTTGAKTKNITFDDLAQQISAEYGLGGSGGQTPNVQAALDGANSPSSSNVFATINDIAASGGGDMLKAVYDANLNNVTDSAEGLYDPVAFEGISSGAVYDHVNSSPELHREINDAGTSTTDLYSADRILSLYSGFMVGSNNLSELTNATTARNNLNLGNSATLNTGTTAGTVATGDHLQAVAAGGTGATDGPTGLFNLGLTGELDTLNDIPDYVPATNNFVLKKVGGVLTWALDEVTGTSTFLDMTDTPSTYAGFAGDCAVVNGTEDGLIFGTCGSGGGATYFTDLLDTPNDLTGQGGLGVFVNAGGTAIEFVASLKTANNLSDLNDAPTARTNLGLGNSAILNTGVATNTVALGNHLHTATYQPLENQRLSTTDDVTFNTVTAETIGTHTGPVAAGGVDGEHFVNAYNSVAYSGPVTDGNCYLNLSQKWVCLDAGVEYEPISPIVAETSAIQIANTIGVGVDGRFYEYSGTGTVTIASTVNRFEILNIDAGAITFSGAGGETFYGNDGTDYGTAPVTDGLAFERILFQRISTGWYMTNEGATVTAGP